MLGLDLIFNINYWVVIHQTLFEMSVPETETQENCPEEATAMAEQPRFLDEFQLIVYLITLYGCWKLSYQWRLTVVVRILGLLDWRSWYLSSPQ